MTNLSIYLIPLAAAITGALITVSQAQAQTPTATHAAGDHADVPAGPNVSFKTSEERSAARPMARSGVDAASVAQGDVATPPAGPGGMVVSAEARDIAASQSPKRMAGKSIPSPQAGDAAFPPAQQSARLSVRN